MPPKKKKTWFRSPEEKPGIAKQHLLDVFAQLPAQSTSFLNGHVLFLFVLECKSSRAMTERKLYELIDQSSMDATQRSRLSSHLKVEIKKLVDKTLGKFKCLSNAEQFRKFSSICQQLFCLTPQSDNQDQPVLPETQSSGADQSDGRELLVPVNPSVIVQLPAPSPIKTRQLSKCTRCKSTRKDMVILRGKMEHMQKTIRCDTSLISCAKKYKKVSIKRLNQTLKRKEAQLVRVKEKLNSSDLADELRSAWGSVSTLKKKNKKMKYHKEARRKALDFSSPSPTGESDEGMILDLVGKLHDLENEKCILEEKVDDLMEGVLETKSDQKSYSADMRMMVFDALVNQVPTNCVPKLIENFARRCKVKLEAIPHRSTVESMARELGVISEYQAAEALLSSEDSTLGFDATTQEHVHVNEIHFTTEESCYSIAIDELPGGTAEDYATHVTDSIDNLANVYSYFESQDFQGTRSKLIQNVTNTLTDRCAANHAAIRIVNAAWNKTLTELNCHLHPLDSVATKVRASLKMYERNGNIPKKILGSDCLAGDLVVQINKLRYKNSKGDPKGFVIFLEANGLPRGLLPRYRGNRLHIFFHICGTLVQYHSLFAELFQKGTSCGGLRSSIAADFSLETAHVEMQVVGLIGKLLTGPWMARFYTSAATEINHIDGISCVKIVISELKDQEREPRGTLTRCTDFFGNDLSMADGTLLQLRESPKDKDVFDDMMRNCLQAIIDVLQKQYKKYLEIDITEQLQKETKSARSHNIDSEQMMGMFSAAQKKAPAATLCYISSKLRAQKNGTVEYLDSLDEGKRCRLLKMAVSFGKKQRIRRRKRMKDLMVELSKRQADKGQERDSAARKKLEKRLKSMDISLIPEEFPQLSEDKQENLIDLLSGKAIGRDIGHLWYEEGELVLYKGRIKKVVGRGKRKVYEVGYSVSGTTVDDDEVDYEMSFSSLAADFIMDDLTM